MTDERRPDGFHYGPTDTDPDHGKMWHYNCGRECYVIDGAYICDCGAQWVENRHGAVSYLRAPRRRVTCRWSPTRTRWLVTRSDREMANAYTSSAEALADLGRVCDEWAAEARRAEAILRELA